MVAAGLAAMGTAAQAAPPTGDTAKSVAAPVDDLPSPAEEKRRSLRQEALSDVLTGEKTAEKRGDSTVVKMGEKAGAKSKKKAKSGKVDQYVELSREKTDKIFVVLAEFGNERHPSFPDQDTDPNTAGPVKFDGPLHNEIPEPDRSKDNSTIWQADYSREHFQDLYFSEGPGRRLGREVLREAVLGSLLGPGLRHRLGEGQVQRGALRPLERLPVHRQRLQQQLPARR